MVNNIYNGYCWNCGDHCQSCNLDYGCETCLPAGQSQGYVNALYDYSGKSFLECTRCSNSQWCTECLSSNVNTCTNCLSTFKDYSTPANGNTFSCTARSATSILENCATAVSDLTFAQNALYLIATNVHHPIQTVPYANKDTFLIVEVLVKTVTSTLESTVNVQIASNRVPRYQQMIAQLVVMDTDTTMTVSQYAQLDIMEQKFFQQEEYFHTCDGSCKECMDGTSNGCTKCYSGTYLSKSDRTKSYGQCLSKTLQSSTQTIYVAAPTTNTFDPTTQTGTIGNPFNDIQDAVMRMYELCANVQKTCVVTIYLMNGDHYLLRRYRNSYRPLLYDSHQQNMVLTIQPLFCSISSHASCVTDGDQITIYNKIRERFQLIVSGGLTMKNIIINSLDSIVDYSTSDSCLSGLYSCCLYDSSTEEITAYNGASNSNICNSTKMYMQVLLLTQKQGLSNVTQQMEPISSNLTFQGVQCLILNPLCQLKNFVSQVQLLDKIKFSLIFSLSKNVLRRKPCLILHKGPILIKNNLFEMNKIAFKDGCDIMKDFYQNANKTYQADSDIYPIFSDTIYSTKRQYLQLKNLITIRKQQNKIEIIENSISANFVIKGAIYIEGDDENPNYSTQTILIKNNYFLRVMSFYSTSAIHIRRYDPNYATYTIASNYVPCGGVLIKDPINASSSQPDDNAEIYRFDDKPSTLDSDEPEVNDIELNSNIYSTNFGGGGEDQDEKVVYLKSNGPSNQYLDYFSLDAFNYGYLINDISNRFLGMIYVEHSYFMIIRTTTFSNNFVFDAFYANDQGSILTLDNYFGYFEIVESSISEQQVEILEYDFQDYLYTYGSKVPLIGFRDDQRLTGVMMFNTTFYNIVFENWSQSQLGMIIQSLMDFRNINDLVFYNFYDGHYPQLFQLQIHGDSDPGTFDLRFQDAFIENLSGNYGGLFNLSLVNPEVKLILSNVQVIDTQTNDGGLINVINGNNGIIQIEDSHFENTQQESGQGGIITVNLGWDKKLSRENSLSKVIVLRTTFIDNYNKDIYQQTNDDGLELKGYLDTFYTKTGYLMFINQDYPISLEIYNSIITQADIDEELSVTNIYLLDQTNQVLNKPTQYVNYGTAFVIISQTGEASVKSDENLYQGCKYGLYGSIFYIESSNSSFLDQHSIYSNNEGIYGGVMYCYNCYQITNSGNTIENTIGYYGGAIYLEYAKSGKTLQLVFQDVIAVSTFSIDNGGFLYYSGEDIHLNLIIKNSSFQDMTSSLNKLERYGGFIQVGVSQNVVFNIHDSTFQNVYGYLGGTIMYFLSKTGSIQGTFKNNIVQCNTDDEEKRDETRELFMDFRSNYPVYKYYHAFQYLGANSSLVNSLNNTIYDCYPDFKNAKEDSDSSAQQGGVYFLNEQVKLYDFNTTYERNGAMRGAIYYCDGCSIEAENNTYNETYCYQGCIVYQDQTKTNTQITFENCQFSDTLVKYSGGLAKFDINTAVQGVQLIIRNSEWDMIMEDVKLYLKSSIDIEDNIEEVVKFENVYLGFTINSATNALINNNYFEGNEKGYGEHILHTIANEDSIYSFEGFFRILNTDNVTMADNIFYSIFVTNLGTLYVDTVQNFSVFNTSFSSCSSLNGGGMIIQNTFGNLTQVTFYDDNAQYGAAFQMLDESQIFVTDSIFDYNWAFQEGGAVMVKRAVPTYTIDTKLIMRNCIFNRSRSVTQGGAFRIEDKYLIFDISNSVFQDIYAESIDGYSSENSLSTYGGIIYAALFKKILINECTVTDVRSGEGVFIYSISQEDVINITNSIFKCSSDKLDEFEIKQFVSNGENDYDGGFSIFYGKVLTENNIYSNCHKSYSGALFKLQESQLIDKSSRYLSNSAFYGAAIQASGNAAKIQIESSIFSENYAYNGGAIKLENYASISVVDCLFQDNYAKNSGGVFLIQSGSIINVENSRFITNSATEASVLSMIDSIGGSMISNSVMSMNQATKATLSFMNSQDIQIYNTIFKQNKAKTYSKNLFMVSSKVSMIQCSFSDLYDKILLQRRDAAKYKIKGGYAYLTMDSFLSIDDSVFSYGFAQYGGAIFVQGSHNVIVPDQGGAIFCYDCGYFWTYKLTIKDAIAKQGGGIYLQETEAFKLTLPYKKQQYTKVNTFLNLFIKFESGYFYNCKSSVGNGGAIFINNEYSMIVTSSTFQSNYATMRGAGMYFECQDSFNCSTTFSRTNTFESNYANHSGGAYFWNDVKPIVAAGAKFTFKNNKGLFYGDNIGSYAQKIVYLADSVYEQQLQRANPNYNSTKRQLADVVTQGSSYGVQNSAKSGGQLPVMYMGLADEDGQIVGTENSKKLTVSLKAVTSNSSNALKYAPAITGISTFYSEFGVFKLSNITFTGSPGYQYALSFVSDGIDKSKPQNQENIQEQAQSAASSSSTTDISKVELDYTLSITLRECAIGERFTDNGGCETCPEGKTFSLSAMKEPGQCKSCPSTRAVCLGGSNIGPRQGYWRKSNESTNFIACFNEKACLGMIAPEYNPQGSCITGYAGALCTDCQAGYSRSSAFECGKCPEYTQNFFRIIFIGIGMAIVVVFMIRSTLKGAGDLKSITSVFQKILLNHIQVIALTASFDFSWPQIIIEYFEANETVGEASNQIFSVDCFLNSDQGYGTQQNQRDQKGQQSFPIRIYFFKLLLFALLPFLLVTICYIVWVIILRKEPDKEILLNKSTSSVVILLFLVHPNIVQIVFNAFNCVDIDGESRMKNDLEIYCYQNDHSFFTIAVALPALIVWGLGIPLFALILLIRAEDDLQSKKIREKFGFLFRGYKKKFFYWEVVITYRKIFLIFIQVFMAQYGFVTQAMLVLLMLIFFMSVNMTRKPFQTTALNELETLSLITSLMTVFCGIFFLVSVETVDITTGEVTGSGQVDLNESNKLLLFFVILLSNIAFFGYWIIKFLVELQHVFLKTQPKLYTFLFLCGDHKKYNLRLSRAMMEEENELRKEKYTDQLKILENLVETGELYLDESSVNKAVNYLKKEKVLQAAGIIQETEEQRLAKMRRLKRKLQDLKNNREFQDPEKAEKKAKYKLSLGDEDEETENDQSSQHDMIPIQAENVDSSQASNELKEKPKIMTQIEKLGFFEDAIKISAESQQLLQIRPQSSLKKIKAQDDTKLLIPVKAKKSQAIPKDKQLLEDENDLIQKFQSGFGLQKQDSLDDIITQVYGQNTEMKLSGIVGEVAQTFQRKNRRKNHKKDNLAEQLHVDLFETVNTHVSTDRGDDDEVLHDFIKKDISQKIKEGLTKKIHKLQTENKKIQMIQKKVNLYDITTKVDESMIERLKETEVKKDKNGKERYRKIRSDNQVLENLVGVRFVKQIQQITKPIKSQSERKDLDQSVEIGISGDDENLIVGRQEIYESEEEQENYFNRTNPDNFKIIPLTPEDLEDY
ncbi:UNKNOWN [Stylonychia lemnae]|uniref:Uncharacterized protein n=1 Tax=Stylonychia lemnae TaxID=5949 RepID=A0A078B2E3_STYLE|nr:UNKNOWN [Stylonychia lemnae]|eukprot:CDW88401.1 UNKNOWN [Stylonychia lemnae]